MPAVRITLSDTYNSIFRPVVTAIVRQVQELSGLKKDIPLFFPKDSEKNLTPGGSVDPNEIKGPRLQTGNYMFIEVEEDHTPNSIATMDINAQSADAIFVDPELDIVMRPIYTTRDVKINFRYTCKNENEARRWRDDMRSQISRLREVNQHSVSFHYTVPLAYSRLLMHVHELREKQGGYNETISRYFRKNFCDRLTIVSSLDGKQRELAIAETQSNISGFFEPHPLVDKPTKDTTDGIWTVTFSYTFVYNEPLDCHLRYPIMVHNQMLDNAYVAFVNTDPSVGKSKLRYQGSRKDLRRFESDYLNDKYAEGPQYIRMPAQDDYILEYRPPGVGTAMMILCAIEESNKISLLNLRDLGDYILDLDILNFILESEREFITDLYKSIFHICIYKNENRLVDESCRVDPDLNVLATYELSIRNQYRVHVGIVTDIAYLDFNAVERLKKYPKVLVKIVSSINKILSLHPRLRELNQYDRVHPYHFNELYRLLTGNNYPNGSIGSSMGTGSQIGIGYNSKETRGLFDDIPGYLVDRISKSTKSMNTVQITGVMVERSS